MLTAPRPGISLLTSKRSSAFGTHGSELSHQNAILLHGKPIAVSRPLPLVRFLITKRQSKQTCHLGTVKRAPVPRWHVCLLVAPRPGLEPGTIALHVS
jgi:hypothetical protein